MIRQPRTFIIIAAVLATFLYSFPAEATIINLNQSNVDLGLTGTFATVDLTVSGDTASFAIDANQDLLGAGQNFGIQDFGFNSTLDLQNTLTTYSLPTGWQFKYDQNLSMFDFFYVDTYGTGKTRVDPLIFSITNAGINSEDQFYVANESGYNYAAHIAGFTNATTSDANGQITSAWFADGTPPAPVPEPATLILFGSGLLGLARLRRKNKN